MSARLPSSGATKASLMEALQNPMPSNGLNGYRTANGHDSMDSNHNSNSSNDAISGAFYRLSHPEVMMRGLIIE